MVMFLMAFLGQITDPFGNLADCKAQCGHRLKAHPENVEKYKKVLFRL